MHIKIWREEIEGETINYHLLPNQLTNYLGIQPLTIATTSFASHWYLHLPFLCIFP